MKDFKVIETDEMMGTDGGLQYVDTICNVITACLTLYDFVEDHLTIAGSHSDLRTYR